jgi:lipoprotein NlpI
LGANGDFGPYAVIVGYLGLRKDGKNREALTFLEYWLKQKKDVAWTTQVLRYFHGDMGEEKLLSLANDNGTRTEAYTYLGEIALLNGDLITARRHLTWVVQNGDKDFLEYNLAVADLRRVETK